MAATCCALRARISCRVIAISPGCVGTVPDKQPMQRRRAVKRLGPRVNAARWRHKARIGPHRKVRQLCGLLDRLWHNENTNPVQEAYGAVIISGCCMVTSDESRSGPER